ncbi:uncharacterized protein PV06_01520 [Exophiala oligosperma]|uniref:Amine oxidase domain-containing protein n=1 Tax=Exophiala oligosperma TaxID=215243 RepID=A0A0D2ECV6_9EURO|nr:uncharacterized protein PV06_01520 [Exophiala oligosperma]KIW45809.1 hypothetical protein PV06_01520 [Exophiala oligosperma]
MSKAYQRPKVAVIGAGFAGLRCADVLLQGGVDVTVFEARNRIGGRVFQVSLEGQLYDVGANWIHEPNENPLMDIAKDTNTFVCPRPFGVALVDSSGRSRSIPYAERLKTTIDDLFDRASEYSYQHSAAIDPRLSIMDYVRDRVTEEFKGQPEFMQDLHREAERRGMWDGDPTSSLSLKHQCLEKGPGGIDVFVSGTYKNIVSQVAKPALEKGVVQLGQKVNRIIYQDDSSPAKVMVETSSGTQESFDEVVVTCPLGWLKKHRTSFFVPELPPPLSQAIDNISFGRLEKIYLTFPLAFWLSRGQDQQSTGSIDGYPCVTHFHHPSYVKNQIPYPANQMIVSLTHLLQGHTQPTILFYIHGPYATQLVHTIKGLEPHGDEYNNVLETYTKPFYSRLPNYAINDPACKPRSYYCSTWQLDDLAGNGSYSNFQIGQADAAKDVAILRDAGVLNRMKGVWFAGEHVAPACRQATTVGAYISGERVAENICKKWDMVLKRVSQGQPLAHI